MRDDYAGFRNRAAGDLGQASLAAQTLDGKSGAHSKMRVKQSDVEPSIPSGCHIEVQPCGVSKLRFGDIVSVRLDKEVGLRRFIRMQVSNKGTFLIVTRQGEAAIQEILRDAALVGRVVGCEFKGEKLNPYRFDKGMAAISNRLTEFGTTSPMEKIKDFLSLLKPEKRAPKPGKKKG